MKRFILLFTLIPLLFSPAADELYPWKAAAAKAVITPPEMIWMAGYSSRKTPAEGTLQDLHAKALAVEDAEGKRLVIVTLDLVFVTREMRAGIETYLRKKHGLPPESLLMNASHTHCGPMIRYYNPPGDDRPDVIAYSRVPENERAQRLAEMHEYLAFLEKKIIGAVDTALENLAPAKLLYSKGRAGFAMNRRTITPNSVRNSPNHKGPVDHDVPVLQVLDAEGKLNAILFGYACHNTTLGIMEFNGDYAGYAQAYIEEDHPGVIALFAEGCGGDQNPYPRRMTYFAERHGRSLAMAVEAGIVANPVPVAGPLRAAYSHATLEYAPAPTRKELEARVISKDPYAKRHAEHLLAELDYSGKLPETYPCPVQVIHFGDTITMAAIGGEAVVDYSLRLKEELAGQSHAVWVLGYSNDGFGYTPSKRVVEEGGYEGATAQRYIRQNLHPGPWKPNIEERIVSRIHQLNRKLLPKDSTADKDKGKDEEPEPALPPRLVDADIKTVLEDAPLSMLFEGRTAADGRAWQKSFRSKLNELLGDSSPPAKWKTVVEETTDFDDHVRYALLLEAEGVPSLPVYLLVPKGLKKNQKVPAVLCVHGHGPYGNDPIVGRTDGFADPEALAENIEKHNYDYGLQFVRRGYVVAAPCMIPFGRRVDRDKYNKNDPCAVAFVRMQALGRLPITANLRDLRWSLDLLQDRPEVDSARLGCAGLSYGGRMTMLVSAIDDRIVVTSVSGALNLLQERASRRYSCGAQIIPGLLAYGDYSEIGSLIAPRPCVWETGSEDSLVVAKWDDVFRGRLEKIYQSFEAPGNLKYDKFEGGHQWSGAVAFPLFEEVLKP